jgi:hypothetical protein
VNCRFPQLLVRSSDFSTCASFGIGMKAESRDRGENELFRRLTEFLQDLLPAGDPLNFNCMGLCEIRLYTNCKYVTGQCRVAFEGESWIQEHLNAPPALSVVTHRDEALHSLLRSAVSGRGAPAVRAPVQAAASGNRSRAGRTQSSQSPWGVEVLWNDHLQTGYVLDHHQPTVHVVVDASSTRLDTAVIHAIREWAMAWLHCGLGWIPLHASAVRGKGHGVMFMGRKQAGKTSTMLAFLQAGGYQFVTNDRAFLRMGENGCEVVGFPYWLKIRPDSFRYFPALHRLDHTERSEGRILSALGAQRCGVAGLDLACSVRFDARIKRPRIHLCSPAEALEQLGSNVLNCTSGAFGSMAAAFGRATPDGDLLLKEVSEQVPVIRLSQNIAELASTVRYVQELLGTQRT